MDDHIEETIQEILKKTKRLSGKVLGAAAH